MTLEKLLLMSLRSPYVDNERIYPPLGILYLKSAIEQNTDIEVDLMDDYDLTKKEIFEPYKWVGLSVMTPQREEALKVLNAIKSNYPDKKVIIGGPHALHYLNEVKEQPYDYIVPKDGQRSLLKILKEGNNRVEYDFMNKLDWSNQPRPDRYTDKAKKFLSSYSYTLQGRRAGTMLTALGCPEHCKFCEDAQTAVRWSSIDNLKNEMDDLINLGYKGVYCFDDLFAIAMPKITPILKELKKRDLIFRCNGQARYFTKWGEDFAKLLAEHGCVEIAFGHETGSQKILDNIEKRTTIGQNYKSIEYAKKYGIKVKSFIMLGLPGEDDETIRATEEFIKNGGMDDFQLAIYYPYKGTKLRDAIDKGEANFDLMFQGEGLGAYNQMGTSESVVRTNRFSSEELKKIRDRLESTYRKNPYTKFKTIFETNQNSKTEYD